MLKVVWRWGLREGQRWLLLPSALLALLLVLATPEEPAPLPGLALGAPARASAWWIVAMVLLPLVALTAARCTPTERAWLRTAGQGLRYRVGRLAGQLCGAALGLVLLFLCLEGPLEDTPAWRHARSHDLGRPERVPAGQEARLFLDLPTATPGTRLCFTVLSALGAGPTCEVQLHLAREGLVSESPITMVDGRGQVRASLPAGMGPVTVTFRCLGPADALLAPGRSLVVESPASGLRRASLECALLVLSCLALAALLTLLGCQVLRPTIAALLALSLCLLLVEVEPSPPAALAQALSELALGRLGRPLGLGALFPIPLVLLGTLLPGNKG